MPPLISQEEALRLGQIEDHAEIEALIERAWQARVERFGDSTDMPAPDGRQTAGGETAGMELIVLAVFVAVLAFVAWKAPSASRR